MDSFSSISGDVEMQNVQESIEQEIRYSFIVYDNMIIINSSNFNTKEQFSFYESDLSTNKFLLSIILFVKQTDTDIKYLINNDDANTLKFIDNQEILTIYYQKKEERKIKFSIIKNDITNILSLFFKLFYRKIRTPNDMLILQNHKTNLHETILFEESIALENQIKSSTSNKRQKTI